ncbi:MAG: hypothetical protein EOP64_00030 [Sphingomonas sp.]|nr:MAG: hypothetical protein EOP64_00030 [Sphingomonas sp.]
MTSFDQAFGYAILNEGQIFTDDPADRGGATRYGITQRTLSEFLGKEAPKDAVAALTMEQAKEIYRKLYWTALGLDAAPAISATALFDTAILCGQGRAIRLTQKALVLTIDGNLGPVTRGALLRAAPSGYVYRLVPALAEHFFALARADVSQQRFLEGWVKRAMRLLSLIAPAIA